MSSLSPSQSSSLAARAAAAAPTTPPRSKRPLTSAFFGYSPSSDSGSDFSSRSSSCCSSPGLSSGASSTVSSPFGKMTFSSPKRPTFARSVLDDDSDDDILFDRTNSSFQDNFEPDEVTHTVRFEFWTKDKLLSLRYSQNSIMSETSSGESLIELQKSIAKGWSCNKSQSLTVVQMPDNTFVSLDNRRLYCIKKIAKIARSTLTIPVKIHHFSEIADPKYLFPIHADLKNSASTIKKDALTEQMTPSGIKEDTYGFCVYARMRVFNKQSLADNSFGFTNDPKVRT